MIFINPIFFLFILQLLFISKICQGCGSTPVIINKGRLQLAYPTWVPSPRRENDYIMEYALPLPPWNQIYHFCPPSISTDQSDSALTLQLKAVDRNSKPAYICETYPKVAVVKVLNVEKFKKNWSTNMEWYVTGFRINSQELADTLKISNEKFDTGFRYESLNKGEAIVPGCSAFYDTNIKQMIAAQYDLLSAKEYFPDPTNLYPFDFEATPFPDLSNFYRFFNKIQSVGVYKKKFNDVESHEKVMLVTLISPAHFIYWFHKYLVQVPLNVAPMWHKYEKKYQNINSFLEIVARRIGKLKVTSGITGLGTTDEEREQRTYMSIFNDVKIVISDFLWKVVEFKYMKVIYGIILVQVNTLSEPNFKICEEDVCNKYNWLVRNEGEENLVYCCDLTASAIEKLEVPFLNFEERREFDLTSWDFGVKSG